LKLSLSLTAMKTRKRLAVYASRARDYQVISKALTKASMDFTILDPSKPPPREVGVVVTAKEDLEKLRGLRDVKVVGVEVGEQEALIVAKAALALHGKPKFGELVVGIDPGCSYGLAFVADSTLIGFGVYREAEEVFKLVKDVVEAGLSMRAVVRVGGGSPQHRDRVLAMLKEGLRGVRLEVVDEAEAPTLIYPQLAEGLPKDAASAVCIALKKGLTV